MNNGIYAGPPVTKKPCVHDSRRLDGWLDTCCMKCGADGYWREGSNVLPVDLDAHIHPCGKILLREKTPPKRSREMPRLLKPLKEFGDQLVNR